jgi:hypothetical protein
MISSPRRALDSTPPRNRALMKCSSASYADHAVMPTGSGGLVVASVVGVGCSA